jgi:hypothetical protein
MPVTIEHTGSAGLHPIAFAQVTIATTAVGFSMPEGVQVKRAWVTAHTANAGIRYRFGADPTTTEGHVLSVGQSLEIIGHRAISAFKMIRNGSTSCEVAYTLEI